MKLIFSIIFTFLLLFTLISTNESLIPSSLKDSSVKNKSNFDSVEVSKSFLEKNQNEIKSKEVKYTVTFTSTLDPNKTNQFSLIRNEHCVLKSGVSHILVGYPDPKVKSLKVKGCYVTLSPESVFFFKSFKKSDLFASLKVNEIVRITQNYPGTNCFDIHSGNDNSGNSLQQVTLCYKTKKDLNEWINALIEFKKCHIVQVNQDNGIYRINGNNGKKGNKVINGIKRNNGNKNHQVELIKNPKKREENLLKKISYVSDFKKPQQDIVYKSILKKSVANLLKTYKKGFVAEKRLKRIMLGNLEKEAHKMEKNENKEISVKSLVDRRLLKERENEIKLIKLEHKQKELTLINQAKEKLEKLRIKELHDTENFYRNKILYKKQQAKEKAVTMLRMLRNQKKLSNWSVCVSKELKGFENKRYVNKLCLIYYGESKYSNCVKKENFCKKCCHFHIGLNHNNIRLKCTKKCRKLVNYKVKKNKKSITNKRAKGIKKN